MSTPHRAAPHLRIARWAQRYSALVRAAWLVDVQYRAAIGIWMIWGVLEPAIALGIWWSIAGQGSVGGYAQSDFARYFFAVMLVNQLTVAWDAWHLDHWIRQGELNYRLSRPLAPVHEAIADNVAYKFRTASLVLVAWIVAASLWPAVRLPFSPERWLIAMVAIVLAAAIRFFNGYATGLLAFWTTRATALTELQFGVSLFLAGRIAPLTLLPPTVQHIATLLWFPWTLAFPVGVLTGTITSAGALADGFLRQLVWLAVWWGAYRVAWGRGVQRYGAVGG
jgi:ABC-2 type transport system permease protein